MADRFAIVTGPQSVVESIIRAFLAMRPNQDLYAH